jgi:hypothetical protein
MQMAQNLRFLYLVDILQQPLTLCYKFGNTKQRGHLYKSTFCCEFLVCLSRAGLEKSSLFIGNGEKRVGQTEPEKEPVLVKMMRFSPSRGPYTGGLPEKNAARFVSAAFPYVCPEPVLVKRSV